MKMSALSLLFVFALIVPSALSFSCMPCEDREGCETIQKGRADWDEVKEEWTLIEPCGCEYNCQPVTPSGPSPIPCDQQTEGSYYQSVLRCGGNPEHPGVWIATNGDPENCEGYCDYNILTFTFPPTPTPPTPSPTKKHSKKCQPVAK